MANHVITGISLPENVGTTVVKAGEAIAAFDVVYSNTSKQLMLADATDVVKANALYITLIGGALGEYIVCLPLTGNKEYKFTVGTPWIVADRYVLSATPGKIALVSDLLAGQFRTDLLLGESATNASAGLGVTGIATP